MFVAYISSNQKFTIMKYRKKNELVNMLTETNNEAYATLPEKQKKHKQKIFKTQ